MCVPALQVLRNGSLAARDTNRSVPLMQLQLGAIFAPARSATSSKFSVSIRHGRNMGSTWNVTFGQDGPNPDSMRYTEDFNFYRYFQRFLALMGVRRRPLCPRLSWAQLPRWTPAVGLKLARARPRLARVRPNLGQGRPSLTPVGLWHACFLSVLLGTGGSTRREATWIILVG